MIRSLALTWLLAAAACSASGQVLGDAGLLLNGGFEDIAQAGAAPQPAVWRVDGPGTVYRLDGKVRHGGRYALHVGFRDGANQEGYSGTLQRASALAVAGKRIAFTAWLRRTPGSSKAGIWILFADASGKRLAYVNSYEQPVATGDASWSEHRLEIDVPPAATSTAFGAAIYEADGDMWVDDLSISWLPDQAR